MSRCSTLASRCAAMAAGLAVMLMGAPPSQAADLDDYGPPQGSYKDRWGDRGDYDSGPHRSDYRRSSSCVPRDVIRSRLEADGWRYFENADPRGPYVVVEARRPSGRLFHIRVDRCSGEVVLARPLEPPPRYFRRSRWDERRYDRRGWHRRDWDRADWGRSDWHPRTRAGVSLRAGLRFDDVF